MNSCSPVSASSTVTRPSSGSAISSGSNRRTATTSWRCASRASASSQPGWLMKSDTTSTSERRLIVPAAAFSRSASEVPPPPAWACGRCAHALHQVQHMQARQPRRQHGVDPRAVEHRADAVAVAREHPRQQRDEAGGHGQLGHVGRAEVDAARQVEQQPGGHLAVFGELAHIGRLLARGDVPVDVAHVVVQLVLAQVGQVDAGAAQQRAVVALQQAVQAAQHGPFELPQQPLLDAGLARPRQPQAWSALPLSCAWASGLSGTPIFCITRCTIWSAVRLSASAS